MGKNSKITPLDYLLAILIAIYFWCAEHLARSDKCKKSPTGTHFYICKDFKNQCKWCGSLDPGPPSRAGELSYPGCSCYGCSQSNCPKSPPR